MNLWHDGVTPVPTKIMLDFICDYVDGQPTPFEETSEVMWVPREKALGYITAPAQRMRFENVLNFDGRAHFCTYVTQPEYRLISRRYL